MDELTEGVEKEIENENVLPLQHKILTKIHQEALSSLLQDQQAAYQRIGQWLNNLPLEKKQQLEKQMQENSDEQDLVQFLVTEIKKMIIKSDLTINLSLKLFADANFVMSDTLKNVWIVPSTKPQSYHHDRNEVEETLFGFTGDKDWKTSIQEQAHSRPLYGSLNYEQNPCGGSPDYGAVVLKLDNAIKLRSTLSPCDSFDIKSRMKTSEQLGDYISTIDNIEKIIRHITDEQLDFMLANLLEEKVDFEKKGLADTIEIQILSRVNTQEDVTKIYIVNDEICVRREITPGFKEVSKEIPSLEANLKLYGYKNNISIYLIDKSGNLLKAIYDKGQAITILPSALPTPDKFTQPNLPDLQKFLAEYQGLGNKNYHERTKLLIEFKPVLSNMISKQKDPQVQTQLKSLLKDINFEAERIKVAAESAKTNILDTDAQLKISK